MFSFSIAARVNALNDEPGCQLAWVASLNGCLR